MKRILDIFVALALLALLSPLMLAVAISISIVMGPPLFFRQLRPGLNAELFEIIKFRTMQSNTEPMGQALDDRARLTTLGRFLRNTSLDELPELWNVIRGDMSLVGPRPLLVEYLPLYSQRQARRHEIRPGITGWAQVNGRNAISWEDKFELDVWYVDNQSLKLDIKIAWYTVLKTFRQEGISEKDQATMSKFTGTRTSG